MSDESRSDEFEMPPELSALENSLRELPLPSNSVVDRDELMFQSGWVAALANRDANTAPNSASAARWVWPTLTGTFATLSAALAIALFSPAAGDNSIANQPAAQTPQIEVATSPSKSNETKSHPLANSSADWPVDSNEDSVSQNPVESALRDFAGRIFRLRPSPTSALAIRNSSLRSFEFDETPRLPKANISTRPLAPPLRANSHKNQQLWEQL